MPNASRMSYWAKARAWAKTNTKTFTFWKAIPSALAAVLQWGFLELRPMEQTLAVIGTLLGGYALLHGLEFAWNLFIKAPVAIATSIGTELESSNRTIAGLQAELSRKRPIDQAKEMEVSVWLSTFSDDEKKFMAWLLRQGETEDFRLRNCQLPQDVINGALTKGRQTGLIKDRSEKRSVHRISFINPSYADTLAKLLHPW